jgi:hypothetical protein
VKDTQYHLDDSEIEFKSALAAMYAEHQEESFLMNLHIINDNDMSTLWTAWWDNSDQSELDISTMNTSSSILKDNSDQSESDILMMNADSSILKDNTSEIASIDWSLNENKVLNILRLKKSFINKSCESHQVSDTLSVSTSVAEKLRESSVNKNSDESEYENNMKNEEKMNLSADEKLLKSIEDQYAFLSWKDW